MQSQRHSAGSASSQSRGPRPGWAPPRAPLPPHRLAKLANALGVSTPLPAISPHSASLMSSHAHSGSSPLPPDTDLPCRSVTPLTTSALNVVSPAQSKYLLHVIPPAHLPHEVLSSDVTELVPPPSTASGYHTQFRRGTLVALQPTLQAQLFVIAREYALPNTMGIVLYLVTASPQSRQNSPTPSASPFCDTGGGEPGPRLSEEIWKHIWTRVLRAERDEVIALSRSRTPNPFGPDLAVDPNGPSHSLRPLVTPTRAEQPRPIAHPITPSTSTGSFVSDSRSHEKSTGASSHSEPNTPDTSRSSDHGPPDIELPGLNTHSIIPILAKVEFDIDRRKATWYEPWIRSRRMKRTESRSSQRSDSRSRTLDSGSSADEKRAQYDLKLVQRMQKPSFLRSLHDSDEGDRLEDGEYTPLSDSPDADAAAAASMTSMECDPLGDVFGTDPETWTEIHAESDSVRRSVDNPNVVELALDGASLSALPEQRQESGDANDVDEVRDIMQCMSRPPLSVSIPSSAESKRKSSPSTAIGRRSVPPPLVLIPKTSPIDNSIDGMIGDASSHAREGLSLELEQEYQRSRNPGEDKRVGTVFEDLDLGLDLGDDDEEYDENDPNDRRRSQYLMKAKLDEIERTLAQFSPRQLKTAKLDEDPTITHRRNFSNASQPRTPAENPFTSPSHRAWPSIPYTSVTQTANGSPTLAGSHPLQPVLALNGVSTGAPRAFMPTSSPSSTAPTESQLRRRDLEQATYPVMISSPSRQINIATDSPIPLSPDPFGRHPSVYEVDAAPVESYWDLATQTFSHEPLDSSPPMSSTDDGSGSLPSATPSSRFSADSSSAVDQGDKATKPTAPLVSVKGFKKLWRKSKSSSNALPQLPTPGRTSFQLSSSPHPPTPTDQLMARPVSSAIMKGSNGKVHVGQLQLDQASRPSLSGSRPASPVVLLNAPQEKPSVRKSIMKSLKSVTGAVAQQPTNGSEPRKSFERPISNETIKAGRPSITGDSAPRSPQLPEHYLSSNHVRTGSNFLERRKSAARSKTGPGQHHSSASHDLLPTILPAWPSIVQTGSASPSPSYLSATSRDSQVESRTSLETSQFEIVSPKAHPNLTYPYMMLDHE